ncbi:heme lyase CcmF/NrfE family subunit [Lichenibacterium minor]|uniref:Heme lyase CcmF/NrfE family subunit n=1 Tax=Lichenibacterium minor TaxID=2316528 RepID=A0A4Q2U6L2_9HYPH|nr:heme lyase CcmF/NrfE family subunit [Lichenibacterium minor]RYC31508.1 heme lyase CcmF/NrfE family subunit [Lichenibacterium minor]
MFIETGHFALVLALALALVQSTLPLWGSVRRDLTLMGTAVPVAIGQFALVAYSFACLAEAHVVSDFSLVNVVENTHSTQPLVYKIASVWGNHEGSMLLWVLILALFGASVAGFGRGIPMVLRSATLAVQGWIASAFLLFILLTSDPFARVARPPIEGRDLNPILQDLGLAIHPPLLYLGYVGFSIVFSFAAAALITGRVDAGWARFVRPWALLAWTFLTLGIAMGSYWAYYTLGWGGFWFWDPVENASLMPWLAGTALLHCTSVMEKREALKVWTIFLAITTFSLSLLGTFLVRSGVLTSVHSFASDPTRGTFILLILALFIGGSFALYAWRAPMLRVGGIFAPVSREGSLVFNNLFLSACCATVLVGTLYPLALEATTGQKISVGAPFFNLTFGPLMVPLLFVMPFGPALAWKRGDLLGAVQRLMVALTVGLVIAVVLVAVTRGGPVLAPLGVGLAAYIIVGALSDVALRVRPRPMPLRTVVERAAGLPRSAWGTAIAHAGMGVTLLGLAATGWGVERIAAVHPGQPVDLGPYSVTITALVPRPGPNYSETLAQAVVMEGGRVVAEITPAKRFFATRQQTVAEAGIVTLGLGQVYVSLGDQHPDGTIDTRMFWKPLVSLIWGGALVMAFGGLLSLSDRRLRIGVAFRRPRPAAAGPRPPVPAE